MEILKENKREGSFLIRINSLEDLWYLEKAIEEKDIVKGRAERKIKINEKTTTKKSYLLSIEVEKIEIKDEEMRVMGKTLEENDDIPKGSYQTIELNMNSMFELRKKNASNYLSGLLKEAKEKSKVFLFVIFDREEVQYYIVKSTDIKLIAEEKGNVSKKYSEDIKGDNFYEKIVKMAEEIKKDKKAEQIVYGCPSFFMQEIKKEGAKGLFFPISEVSKRAINEILKSNEFSNFSQNLRVGEEIKLLDEFLKELRKEGLVDYGLQNIKNYADSGAIKTMLVTNEFFKKNQNVIKKVDDNSGDILIANDDEVIKTLENFGGAIVFLRYKN